MLSLTWKDTRTSGNSAKILCKCLPLLLKNSNLYSFLGKDVLAHALQVNHKHNNYNNDYIQALRDGYHLEGHDTIVALITELYIQLRPLTPIPSETLLQLVPDFNADPLKLQDFEAKLKEETTISNQKRIVKDAFKSAMGVKPGQWFRNLEPFSSKAKLFLPTKAMFKKSDLSNSNTDLGLLDLFNGQ